jgi:hypothetical protein
LVFELGEPRAQLGNLGGYVVNLEPEKGGFMGVWSDIAAEEKM